MEATRRQRTLRALTLIGLGMSLTLLVSLDPANAWRAPGWLAMAVGASLWTVVENLALRQDEPKSYRGKGGTRLLQAGVMATFLVAAVDAFHLPPFGIPRGMATAVAGGALLLLGATVRVWAIRALDRHFRYELRVETGQQLVRAGPYRWVRHPSYLGLILVAAGGAFAMGSVLGVLFGVGFLGTVLALRIREEESILREALPGYAEYSQGTWRLVPFVY